MFHQILLKTIKPTTVELSLISGGFIISLKQGDSEPCNISESPHSIDAHFGRADYGKRKRSADGDLTRRKRHQVVLWQPPNINSRKTAPLNTNRDFFFSVIATANFQMCKKPS
jgi:hypothetical protein